MRRAGYAHTLLLPPPAGAEFTLPLQVPKPGSLSGPASSDVTAPAAGLHGAGDAQQQAADRPASSPSLGAAGGSGGPRQAAPRLPLACRVPGCTLRLTLPYSQASGAAALVFAALPSRCRSRLAECTPSRAPLSLRPAAQRYLPRLPPLPAAPPHLPAAPESRCDRCGGAGVALLPAGGSTGHSADGVSGSAAAAAAAAGPAVAASGQRQPLPHASNAAAAAAPRALCSALGCSKWRRLTETSVRAARACSSRRRGVCRRSSGGASLRRRTPTLQPQRRAPAQLQATPAPPSGSGLRPRQGPWLRAAAGWQARASNLSSRSGGGRVGGTCWGRGPQKTSVSSSSSPSGRSPGSSSSSSRRWQWRRRVPLRPWCCNTRQSPPTASVL